MHYSRAKANRKFTLYDIAKLSEEESWEIFRVSRFGKGEKFKCLDCEKIDKHWFISTRKE